jgi:hypothetical protein
LRVPSVVLAWAAAWGLAPREAPASNPRPASASEITHVIFIVDGSSSILPGPLGQFDLQKQGIIDSLCGPGWFVPRDGTVAVGVLQFSLTVTVEVPLTVLDGPASAESVCAAIEAIDQMSNLSALAPPLDRARSIFETVGGASNRFVVLSTDGRVDDHVDALDQARVLRTMSPPTTICAVEVANVCDPPGLEEAFLKNCANTADAQEYEPSEPEGHYGCAQYITNLDEFVGLSRTCLCLTVNAGGADCDENGVPDRCETDCNGNGILDLCDIRDGLSDDCTGNGIPDECEPDCNENGQADSCDIAGGTSDDCNENGVPDECELGACCEDAAGLCTEDVTVCACAGRWIEGAACDPDPFMPPCGTSACCEPNGHCSHQTADACAALGGFWDEGLACGDPCQHCGWLNVCYDGVGSCSLAGPSGAWRKGCEDRCCCIAQCEADPYCCLTEWDQQCADNALALCDLPPHNDECWDPDAGATAWPVAVPSSTQAGVFGATQGPEDPGFCCHGSRPATRGYGTVWFTFLAPPAPPGESSSSVQLATCCSTAAPGAPADDSLLEVFRVRDPDRGVCDDGSACSLLGQDCDDGSACVEDHTWACANLVPIGCSDDAGLACTCGYTTAPQNSKLCVAGVTPGQKYYVLLAAKADENRGVYRLEVTAGCEPATHTCPSGAVRWVDPPAGVVDARQPHAVDDPALLHGISEMTVEAPASADDPCCWTICETQHSLSLHPPYEPGRQRNAIVGVLDEGDGAYRITLDRPITPGETTCLTYTDQNGVPATGLFTSHPGNVDGDGYTAPGDILKMIDYLNGVDVPPWGVYSDDVDHSGQRKPADILRVIDLLNGAGAFGAWLNTPRPECGECCP